MKRWWAGCTLGVAVLGCGPQVSSEGGDASSTGEATVSSTNPSDPTTADTTTGGDHGRIQIATNRDAAILFVVDNSGTMGAAQAKLAQSTSAFVDALGDTNVRIAITTTDNGNPWCGTTTPESGSLVLSSCRERTGGFVFNGDPPADASETACLDVCALDAIEIVPTATERDPELRPRPWLEHGTVTNLPDGVALADALACTLPQGIDGCGFESHLESMYKSMLRFESEQDPSYGFVGAAAVLAVVLVSDETDCSYATEWESIFLSAGQGGNPAVFWTDPTAAAPTSAVCWNAGVSCSGGPGTYDECHAENKDVDGNEGVDDGAAVMMPTSRYVEYLQQVEDTKQTITPDQQVIVAAIAGVPQGYDSGSAEITYADANDPTWQETFGIAPGCIDNASGAQAVPPVREREVVEAFETQDVARSLYSICEDDYGGALAAIADRVRDQLQPSCVPACIADADLVANGLQPECTIVQQTGYGTDESTVPQCAGDQLTDDTDVCWFARVDQGGITPEPWDDMSAYCSDLGWNLELGIVRREGVPAPAGTSIEADCQLSNNKAVDCPALP
ncbi:MAG TPA: VWA domain-containing protein [Nannocystaceae bacterium]|nr:VWA domain-containing protein [Nannocystaceae bacterium]